jgi:hypothetical protein
MNTGAEARANFAALRGPLDFLSASVVALAEQGKRHKRRSPTVLSRMERFYGQSDAREMTRVSRSTAAC